MGVPFRAGHGGPVLVRRPNRLLLVHQVLHDYGPVLSRQARCQALDCAVGAVLGDVNWKLAPVAAES